jgi:predicted short-subunit dehydrogenase-like oxidoreductase (DUF2520 family)
MRDGSGKGGRQPARLDPEVTETVRARSHGASAADPASVPPAPPAASPPTLAFVGAGRAAGALAAALAAAGHPVVAVSSRDPADAAALAGKVGARSAPTALAAIRCADVTFLTVPDAAITGVAAAVAATGAALRGRAVVHCSASLGPEALVALRLTGAAAGCLHPLQALSGELSAPLLKGALIAIDADPPLRGLLEGIALDLGGHPVALASGSRPLYHAAAVLAGNAPLALLAAAAELLAGAGLEPRDAEQGLLTLMEGALTNARRVGPRAALTGPVVRGDTATVAAHLAALQGHPDADALYRALTRELLRLAGAGDHGEIASLLDDPHPRSDRAPAGRTPPEPAQAGGHRAGGTGLRAERRLCAGGSSNAAEQRAPSASQGARTPVPERSTCPAPPTTTEASTCP